MPGIKASHEEITDGTEAALAEAISQLDAVNGTSVAGLLDAYLDVAVSSRSSHDWDPNGTVSGNLDIAVSTRSSHQWDPQGRIDAPVSTRSSHNWDPNGTVAGNLDTAVSSRSSHDWDPQGYIDAPISSAGSFSSLTPQTIIDAGTGDPAVSVSGSGYIFWMIQENGDGTGAENYLNIDGSTVWSVDIDEYSGDPVVWGPLRFDESFELGATDWYGSPEVSVHYALE